MRVFIEGVVVEGPVLFPSVVHGHLCGVSSFIIHYSLCMELEKGAISKVRVAAKSEAWGGEHTTAPQKET
jgi:hypothetical protein